MSASNNKIVDRLRMPRSTVDTMSRAVGDELIRSIVEDNRRRATPPTPKHSETVRPLSGEALERWLRASREPNVVFEYDPFANDRIW